MYYGFDNKGLDAQKYDDNPGARVVSLLAADDAPPYIIITNGKIWRISPTVEQSKRTFVVEALIAAAIFWVASSDWPPSTNEIAALSAVESIIKQGPLPIIVSWDRRTGERRLRAFKDASSVRAFPGVHEKVHVFVDRDIANAGTGV